MTFLQTWEVLSHVEAMQEVSCKYLLFHSIKTDSKVFSVIHKRTRP